jgi:oligopeptidase B
MTSKVLCFIALVFAGTALNAQLISLPKKIKAPVAAEIPHRLEKHGDTRIDEYFWLKDRKNPKVIQYLKNENKYLDQVMKPTEKLKKDLFKEMKKRIKEDDSSYPLKNGPFYYYSRYETGKQYPIYARKGAPENEKEEIIFDINKMAKGHDFYSAEYSVSPDHKLAALAYDTVGRRFYNIKFKNLNTGKFLKFEIKDSTNNYVWAKDNKTIFFVKQEPETLRYYQVHKFDIETGKSSLVYEEKEETFYVYLHKALARQHIFINTASTLSSEVWIIPADKPESEPKLLLGRERTHEFGVSEDEKYFYFQTNKDAKNFKVTRTPIDKPDFKNAETVVAHRSDTFIDNIEVFDKYIVLNSRANGLTQIEIYNKDTKELKKLSFQDTAYSVELGSNAEYKADSVRYVYQSLRSPSSIYDYEFASGKSILRKTKEVPNYDLSLYVSDRIFATARDGKKIPISILRKKDVALDGKAPLLIYGYGSYGANLDPWFSSTIFSLVDRGFIYAIAHVRGGGEMGRYWTDEGRTLQKKNTFNDFIDSTDYLLSQKYADPKKVFAMGGSAGGLLMGSIMNMRPDLYLGVVAQVPFVDVVTTMLDDTIPLTTSEYDEWGNPNDKTFYDYIKTYSPYDNVKKVAYPNTLITTGLHDSQVQYWEPAKWAARLRKNNTANTVILLKTDMKSGHGGKTGRFDQLHEVAEEFAFILGLVK